MPLFVGWRRSHMLFDPERILILPDFLCIGQLGYIIDLTTFKLAATSDGLGVNTLWEGQNLEEVGCSSAIAAPGGAI